MMFQNDSDSVLHGVLHSVPDCIQGVEFVNDEPTFIVNSSDLVFFCTFLRDAPWLQCKQLSECTAVDLLPLISTSSDAERSAFYRFKVVYQLRSVHHSFLFHIEVYLQENEAVDSLTSVFPAAGWAEREVWDMFGIFFRNHPDLRRILTDYGFDGHPLRKDFPLSGYVEVKYDDAQKRVVTQPLDLTQEFRRFDFASPWETNPSLPTSSDTKS